MKRNKVNLLKTAIFSLVLGVFSTSTTLAAPSIEDTNENRGQFSIVLAPETALKTQLEKPLPLSSNTEAGVPFNALWLLVAGLVGFVAMSHRRGI